MNADRARAYLGEMAATARRAADARDTRARRQLP
jgi:hypothetical protein